MIASSDVYQRIIQGWYVFCIPCMLMIIEQRLIILKEIGIYINNRKNQAQIFGEFLLKQLSKEKFKVWVETNAPCNLENTDLIIVIGGDGTLLEAFGQFGKCEIPFLCINFGNTGFLSAIEPKQFHDYWPLILNEKYYVEERSVMQISITRDAGEVLKYHALNDVVIRSTRLKTCRQILKIDGKMFAEYEGDGVVCSTSTGSTAYSLSAGGAIIDPQLQAITITPICSKIKSLRPIVLSFDHTVEIICDDNLNLCSLIGIDGKEKANLCSKDVVRIDRASIKAKLVQLEKGRYLNRIQYRLGIKGL